MSRQNVLTSEHSRATAYVPGLWKLLYRKARRRFVLYMEELCDKVEEDRLTFREGLFIFLLGAALCELFILFCGLFS